MRRARARPRASGRPRGVAVGSTGYARSDEGNRSSDLNRNIVLPITADAVGVKHIICVSSVEMDPTKGGHNAGGNLHSACRKFDASLSGDDTGEQITVHSF